MGGFSYVLSIGLSYVLFNRAFSYVLFYQTGGGVFGGMRSDFVLEMVSVAYLFGISYEVSRVNTRIFLGGGGG